MTKRFKRMTIAVLAVTLLTACGGGGGADAGSAEPVVVDRARPLVSYVTPTNNDTAAPSNLTISVAFSEPMAPQSLDTAISLTDLQSGAAVPLSGVDYDPLNKIATVTPLKPLAGNDRYRATVSTTATDISGNALESDYSWSFDSSGVADNTAPTVSSVSPAIAAQGAPLKVAVALSFSEAMKSATLSGAFTLQANGTLVTGLLEYVGQAAVFTPHAPLAPNTTYTATLDTAATDLAGNPLAAAYTWQFTTGAQADTTPPVILGVSPAPGPTNVAGDSAITIHFDGPIYPVVFGSIDGFVTPVSIDYATNTMTVQPSTRLKPGNTYTSRVTVGDLAGNKMAAPYEWSFTIAP